MTTAPPAWTLRPATAADLEPLAELRAGAMRPDLERLGRYDEHGVRQRLRDAYRPRHTSVVEVPGFPSPAGCLALAPDERPGTLLLEHFYLDPALHGRGLGTAVLRDALERADAAGLAVRLNVLRGSPARRLYERHGFVPESEGPVDVFLHRPAATAASCTTRTTSTTP
ncbi:L-amino acid N-acyltransferase YncA [Kitasatospora sp. SolWspMP-SS2h]|uniref:GNAT family N-acetyltransferase n=1 Tax=Kitasatospora sp. SolWspMP-SS2h TaxID=1305729 RepID=UPI000DBFDE18|nr:GNAT family N-acetyltransferase [Kitasatospora sp. SolWspMP-SS2h]RAJ35871.1 L-amino acid N-acyltransferase YncA [Kitasatospora sp. SolWspMP-SS2h]